MTTPAAIPVFDPGNPLLASVESRLDTGELVLPDGTKAGALTVRTASTTVTVLLGGGDLRTWAQTITALADRVNSAGPGLTLPTAADVAVVGAARNGRPPAKRRRLPGLSCDTLRAQACGLNPGAGSNPVSPGGGFDLPYPVSGLPDFGLCRLQLPGLGA